MPQKHDLLDHTLKSKQTHLNTMEYEILYNNMVKKTSDLMTLGLLFFFNINAR